MALIFPLVGLGLLIWAISATLHARRFGHSVLLLRTVHGVIGGALAGVVTAPAKIRPRDGFRLRLVSVRRVSNDLGLGVFLYLPHVASLTQPGSTLTCNRK